MFRHKNFVVFLMALLSSWQMQCRLAAEEVSEIELLPPVEGHATTETIVGDEVFVEPTRSWTKPTTWFDSPFWKYGFEIGINGSEGNAQAFSIVTSGNMKRETEGNEFSLDATYGKTQAGGVETQHYALMNSRWDWKTSPTWFLYNKNILEYDEFKAFDLRVSITGGLGYHFIKDEVTTLTSRFGAGASREIGGPDDSWVPEANFGLDFERKISERQKVALTTDYFPSWEDFMDYRLVTNANWEIQLDDSPNVSLKVGAIDRYDSTPNGAQHNDIDYFLTLIWKM